MKTLAIVTKNPLIYNLIVDHTRDLNTHHNVLFANLNDFYLAARLFDIAIVDGRLVHNFKQIDDEMGLEEIIDLLSPQTKLIFAPENLINHQFKIEALVRKIALGISSSQAPPTSFERQ